MKKRKLVAFALATAMITSAFSFQFALAANSPMAETKPVDFDESNIVLQFGAMSDIHQNGSAGSLPEQKFRKAMETLNAKTNNSLDAIFVAGDMTDRGTAPEASQFKTVFTEERVGNTELIYALGNHDSVNGDRAKVFYDTFGEEFYQKDVAKDQILKGNRHVVLNGYHFITIEPSGYGENCSYTQATVKWVQTTLAEINAQNPNAPIFIATHPMQYDTSYGSTLPGTGPGWWTKQLLETFKKYPQVVTFSGHVHHPLNDERSMMQTDFTSLGCGSVSYMAIEGGYTDTGDKTVPYDASNFSQGLLVEVDKNDNIRFRRLDFYNGVEIKEPWIIPAPSADKSHLKYYSKDRGAAPFNKAPVFGADNGFEVTPSLDKTIKVKFKKGSDDDMVHHYEGVVTRVGDSEPTSVIKTLSGFYRAVMPNDFSFDFKNLVLGEKYKVEVFAVDSWGTKSTALSKEVQIPELPINPELLKPDVFDFNITNDLKMVDNSPLKLEVTPGATNNIVKDSRVEGNNIKLDGKTDSAATFVVPNDKTAALMDDFTVDVFFKTGAKSDSQQAIFSNQATGGYSIALEGGTNKLTFNTMINNRKIKISSKEPLKENEYYHAVATYDGKEILLYLDDVMQEKMLISGKVYAPRGEKHIFAIGASPTRDGKLENPFTGNVYKARVFTTPLDTTHVKALSVPVVAPEPDFIKGDVNNDGQVKTVDALLILRHIAKINVLEGNAVLAADFDGNGKVSSVDSLLILRKIAGV